MTRHSEGLPLRQVGDPHGTLTSFDGVPDKKTTELLRRSRPRATRRFSHDHVSRSRDEAGLSSLDAEHPALLFEELMDSKPSAHREHRLHTREWLHLGDEPLVLETPPKLLGILDSRVSRCRRLRQRRPDKAKSASSSLSRPATGAIPEAFVINNNTYGNCLFWPRIQVRSKSRPCGPEASQSLSSVQKG